MAEAAMMNAFDQRARYLSTRAKRVPVAVWRGAVMVLALIWMVYSFAQLVWVLFPAPTLDRPAQMAVVAMVDTPAPTRNVDLSILQTSALFGEGVAGELVEEVAEPVVADVDENVEKTKLNLDLVGVVASSQQSVSSAVIANGREQGIYQTNDELPVGNNVKLAKVLNDRVILDNNGRYEALWLYSEADFKINQSRSAPSRPEPEESEDEAPKEIRTKLKPAEVPKSLRDVVRFSVHREEGQMVGFRIRPSKNRELFEQLGLQANDIVTSVNGIPIDSPQAIRDNYQQLKSATSADLEIRRGEESVYVNVSIDSN